MMSITVTSGGAKRRMGGPQVPLPRDTWMIEPFAAVVVPQGMGNLRRTSRLKGNICPLWT